LIKKQKSIISKTSPFVFIALIILFWQAVITLKIVDEFLLPSPISVVKALILDFNLLMKHSLYTVSEGFIGLILAIILSFILAIAMDRFAFLYQAIYPVLIVSQTVPIIAIAPLLVLWLGYGMSPKIVLVLLACFFPLVVGILDGFKQADPDAQNLLKAMGANNRQILLHIKIPYCMPNFFAGLKVAVSYSMVGAVISEWIGGTVGLGVYMTRVKKSFSFDKMFAVIILIVVLSLILIEITKLIEKKTRVNV
jgi:ABC-type nitrate/sulfonate/bicarbonate transport system permease component